MVFEEDKLQGLPDWCNPKKRIEELEKLSESMEMMYQKFKKEGNKDMMLNCLVLLSESQHIIEDYRRMY